MRSFRFLDPRRVVTLAACVLGCAAILNSRADDSAKASVATPELEAKFIATLTNATLKGRSSAVKDGQLGADKEDAYTIVSVTKLSGDQWQINARIAYGGKTVDLPIPARVKWAGDTPVLMLDNMTMGTSRTYSARVMIYEKTYAGWWTASDHGGLLNGVITNN